MQVAETARAEIRRLLPGRDEGAVPSLLVGYSYDAAWNKVLRVDLAVLERPQVESMEAESLADDEPLLYELDGVTFAIPVSTGLELIQGWQLVYTSEGFSLVRFSS
jgi:hypothetical protein